MKVSDSQSNFATGLNPMPYMDVLQGYIPSHGICMHNAVGSVHKNHIH